MRLMHRIAATAMFVLVLPAAGNALCQSRTSMTHSWNGDDKGKYYVRQDGNIVWWLGESADSGRTWSNVFRGVRKGNIVEGEWVDVVNKGGRGTLRLQVDMRGTAIDGFRKLSGSGSLFGATKWFWTCQDTG